MFIKIYALKKSNVRTLKRKTQNAYIHPQFLLCRKPHHKPFNLYEIPFA